ncbi:hypothetical protein Hanom_Chr03g00200201 [Helianthus anomalus]
MAEPSVGSGKMDEDGLNVSPARQSEASPAKEQNRKEEIMDTEKSDFNDEFNFELKGDNFSLNDGKVKGCFSGVKEGEVSGDMFVIKSHKRKKFKNLLEVGLTSSGEYRSSNERPNKEPKKVDEDPFGLDPIINTMDHNVLKVRGPIPLKTNNSFQTLLDESEVQSPEAEKVIENDPG